MRVIGGVAKGKRLKFPQLSKGENIRPLTDHAREALFNILANEVADCRFLDLFAGTGAVGIEAMSRGAAVSFFVEMNRKAVSCIRGNLAITGFSDRAEVYSIDVLRAIKLFNKKQAVFDIVYIGAPYDSPLLAETLEALSASTIICDDTIVVAERRNKHVISGAYGSLKLYRESRYGDTVLSFYGIKKGN